MNTLASPEHSMRVGHGVQPCTGANSYKSASRKHSGWLIVEAARTSSGRTERQWLWAQGAPCQVAGQRCGMPVCLGECRRFCALTCSSSRLNSQYSRRVPLPLVRIPQPLIMMVPGGSSATLVTTQAILREAQACACNPVQGCYLTGGWSWWLGTPDCWGCAWSPRSRWILTTCRQACRCGSGAMMRWVKGRPRNINTGRPSSRHPSTPISSSKKARHHTGTHLKHFIVPQWAVGHDNAIVELIQGPPPLCRLVVVAEFDEGATFLVEEQGVIGREYR